MKTRTNLVLMLALALTLIGPTLTMADRPGREPMFLRPDRKAHVTSTPPPATPAWPPTAPRARSTPPITARSTRSCASRTARPWTSASSSPSRRRPGCGRIRQGGRAGRVLRQHLLLDHHHLRPIPQAQQPRRCPQYYRTLYDADEVRHRTNSVRPTRASYQSMPSGLTKDAEKGFNFGRNSIAIAVTAIGVTALIALLTPPLQHDMALNLAALAARVLHQRMSQPRRTPTLAFFDLPLGRLRLRRSGCRVHSV